ncbi:uncharacterized protein VTP21DRAFT_5645 [Calcarisporiella thermophila]|uniref:uncharacterized protein n=1 Tax=Calcarisporiella thermophila TaxID=911321 RepID=UPI0037424574
MHESKLSFYKHPTLFHSLSHFTDESSSGSFPSSSKKGVTQEIQYFSENSNASQFLLTANSLRFQLKLNSYANLLRLLSAKFLIEGEALPDLPFHPQKPEMANFHQRPHRCTIFKLHHLPKPVEDEIFKEVAASPPVYKLDRLEAYLFHVYLSDCFVHLKHPDPAGFLKSYYRSELEPALVHTAIAFSAIHLLLTHPQAPVNKQLRWVIKDILAQAKYSLEEVFDEPSPETVLAYLNMDVCMRWLAQLDNAYRYYSQAAMMAISLKMDRDDPNEKDFLRVEFRRRIWFMLCRRGLHLSIRLGKPVFISLEAVRRSPKPSFTSNDSITNRTIMLIFMEEIQAFCKIMELSNIDWSLPDAIIAQHLISYAAFLQRARDQIDQYYSRNTPCRIYSHEFHASFWTQWCALWRQFIKSDAPPARLETDAMRRLREMALKEFVKGLFNCFHSLQEVIRSQNWCKHYPYLGVEVVCEYSTFIAHMHPDLRIQRQVFKELAQIFAILRSLEPKGIIEGWLESKVGDTLEVMKPIVLTKEELVNMSKPRLKRLAIKKKEE